MTIGNYNTTCKLCGSDAYIGFAKIECSNPACTRYIKIVIEQPVEEPVQEAYNNVYEDI